MKLKIFMAALLVVTLLLQSKIWFGEGSVQTIWNLSQEVEVAKNENAQRKERNDSLAAEVRDLKDGLEAIEGRARLDLGMIKKGETFYQVVKE
ncbi:MAG: cell division protein FtsB [Pseudomonadota bacterium]